MIIFKFKETPRTQQDIDLKIEVYGRRFVLDVQGLTLFLNLQLKDEFGNWRDAGSSYSGVGLNFKCWSIASVSEYYDGQHNLFTFGPLFYTWYS